MRQTINFDMLQIAIEMILLCIIATSWYDLFLYFRHNNPQAPVIPGAFYKILVWCENSNVQSEGIVMNNTANVSSKQLHYKISNFNGTLYFHQAACT